MNKKRTKFFELLPDQVKQQANLPLNYMIVEPIEAEGVILHTVESEFYHTRQYYCFPFEKPISRCF